MCKSTLCVWYDWLVHVTRQYQKCVMWWGNVTEFSCCCNNYCWGLRPHCNTLQHICYALLHIVTHITTYDRELCWRCIARCGGLRPHCNTLQHITTHCYTVTHFNTLQHMTELCRCCIARCRGLKLPSFKTFIGKVVFICLQVQST